MFRCRDCPRRVYGDEDEWSHLAHAIWNLYAEWLIPDHPPSLEFCFKLMGVKVGTPESREIYHRMLILSRIIKEHQELTKDGTPENNGQPDDSDDQ